MMPKFNQLMKPVLEVCEDVTMSDHNAEIILAERFKLTKHERKLIKSSGGERLFLNKIRWAKTHLTYAGLIKRVSTGKFRITQRGKDVLELKPPEIGQKFLSRFDEYKQKRGLGIKFSRVWAMPNKWTFEIQPIAELLDEELEGFVVDPFSGNSSYADIGNDLNPNTYAPFHMEASQFLETFGNETIDTLIDDPPYSATQIARSYNNIGLKPNSKDTSSQFYTRYRTEIPRVVKLGGKVIKCGWETNGYKGFTLERILLVPHGGAHSDTIVSVWRKVERIHDEIMEMR